MRKTVPVAGLLAAAALSLTACGPSGLAGSPNTTDTADISATSASSDEGPTTLVRFVVISPPGFGPIDIVDPHDPKHKYATGLTAGTVTDYLQVPQELAATDASGKTLDGLLSGMDDSAPRNTMVIGPSNNNGGANYFKETNGKVGYDPEAISGKLPTDKPIIIGLGSGVLQGGPANLTLMLGQGPGQCVPGAIPDPQTGTINQSETVNGSVPIYYAPSAGALQLSWYGNDGCQLSEATSVNVTMANGEFAYVFPWLADSTHLRFLVVPVTSDQPGQYGVVDAPAGPVATPDPCAVTMCDNGTPVPADPGN